MTPPRPAGNGAKRGARPLDESVVRRPVPLPAGVKNRLRGWRPLANAWTLFRRTQLHREYERRREYYHWAAAERRLAYCEENVASEVRQSLAERGATPAVREIGEVHTFACIPSFAWHRHLLPDLQELGPVTHFDYTAHGYG
ncbi:MAG: hypothetical protein ACREMQ_24330, partial [Longimicrobiales bacterium]